MRDGNIFDGEYRFVGRLNGDRVHNDDLVDFEFIDGPMDGRVLKLWDRDGKVLVRRGAPRGKDTGEKLFGIPIVQVEMDKTNRIVSVYERDGKRYVHAYDFDEADLEEPG